jgi:hypothetical protein
LLSALQAGHLAVVSVCVEQGLIEVLAIQYYLRVMRGSDCASWNDELARVLDVNNNFGPASGSDRADRAARLAAFLEIHLRPNFDGA